MQNAYITYKLRIEIGEHRNRVVEVNMELTEFENEYTIADAIKEKYGIEVDTFGSEYYTVLERNIELFED